MLSRRWAAGAACALLAGCSLTAPESDWDPPPAAAVAAELIPREPCAQRSPHRRAFFGEFHVHTAVSMDAQASGTRATPDDAYRFARGEPIEVYVGPGQPTRTAQLARPLDFTAVTDHAEWMAETSLCTTPGSAAYDTDNCRIWRGEKRHWLAGLLGLGDGFMARMPAIIGLDGRPDAVCGDADRGCRAELAAVWKDMQAAAERWYDRSSRCSFTTFHAWEYSASPGMSKVHRNIILRNEIAPELPLSSIDIPDAKELRHELVRLCNGTGTGCEAIAIPHNPNLSNGQSFALWYTGLPAEEQRREAELRAELEPIVEMMQIKGESECRNGMFQVMGGPDELCEFEKARDMGQPELEDCEEGTGSGAQRGRGCTSRLDFARYALTEGLREERRLGVNPYRFGFVGSTDSHNATPGQTAEGLPEKFGISVERALTIGERTRGPAFWNPGGLAGIYAEENQRDSLYDALTRRETFATSGPRIRPRLYGGWDLPADACAQADLPAVGDAHGVPMGAVLPERAGQTGAPQFLVSALRDPGTDGAPGGLLQRIQIVKGWVDDEGRFHQRVTDVAGEPSNGARVDPATCEVSGPGHDALCAVWTDPEFDASREAVYYARVVENPSCRWTTRLCNGFDPAARPDACAHPRIPKTIQERAWTSPIWFTPPRGS